MARRFQEELPGKLQTRLSRRELLRYGGRAGAALAMMGGVVPLLAACGGDDDDEATTAPSGGATTAAGSASPATGSSGSSGSSGSGGQVRVAVWGGAIQEAENQYVFQPFTEETGIEVIMTGPPDPAKLKAMVDTGNIEWDLVEGGLNWVYELGEEYFEEIDYSQFDQETIDSVPEIYRHKFGGGFYVFSTNIGWNSKTLGEGKQMESWADFWDVEKFPGQRSLQGGSQPPLEFALLADGVEMKDLYPIDVDRALNKLKEIMPNIAQWWDSGAQPGQLLTSEQVVASSIWIGRIHSLMDEGAPIGFTFNQGSLAPAYWNIPKGAQNVENAQKLAAYSMRPDVQANVWGNYIEGPTNTKAFELMDPEYAKLLPTHPDNADKQFVPDDKWWGENRADALEKFQAMILG